MSISDRSIPLPRITLLGTGGTIASRGADSLDLTGYIEHKQHFSIHELVEHFAEIRRVAEITAVPYENFASQAIGPRQWLELAASGAGYRRGAAGA